MGDVTPDSGLTEAEKAVYWFERARHHSDRAAKAEAEVDRLRGIIRDTDGETADAQDERDVAREALTDLVDWAEHIEGEGRLRRTEALVKAREALDG